MCTYTRNPRNGQKRYYYVCPQKRSNRPPKCEHGRYLRAEDLEERIWSFVRDYLIDNPERLLDWFDARIARMRDDITDDRLPILYEQLRRVEVRRQKAIDAYLDGPLTKEDVSARLADLDEQKAALEREIAALRDREGRISELRRIADWVTQVVAELRDRMDPDPVALDLWRYSALPGVNQQIHDLYRSLELRVVSQADGIEVCGVFGQHFLRLSS